MSLLLSVSSFPTPVEVDDIPEFTYDQDTRMNISYYVDFVPQDRGLRMKGTCPMITTHMGTSSGHVSVWAFHDV